MSSNFDFLQKVDDEIFNLAKTAEKLFRDEYFEQCITQTRKLAERIIRNVLGNSVTVEDSFDNMLYKLKTVSKNTMREQEFISDMYFLKKQGNLATHGEKIENSGEVALDCLEHAFEACINFAYSKTNDDTLNRLIFDEKLLVLGEKNQNLQAQYRTELERNENLPDDDEELLNDIEEKNDEDFSKKHKKSSNFDKKSQKSNDFEQKSSKNHKKHKKNKKNREKFDEENEKPQKTFMQKVTTAVVIFCVAVFGILYLMAEVPRFFENFDVKNIFSQNAPQNEPEKLKKAPKTQSKSNQITNPQKQTDYSKDDFSVTKNFSI